MDLSTLLNIDRYLLLSLNGSDSLFWDGCMLVYTSMAVWVPLAIVLLCVLLKNNNIKDFLLLVVLIAILATLTDQISSVFCKPFFERWRPTNDPFLMYAVDVVNETKAGKYGFTSSHLSQEDNVARSTVTAINIYLLIRISCSDKINFYSIHSYCFYSITSSYQLVINNCLID